MSPSKKKGTPLVNFASCVRCHRDVDLAGSWQRGPEGYFHERCWPHG